MELDRCRIQVSHGKRCLWVPVPRLPDTSRVDQGGKRQDDPLAELGNVFPFLREDPRQVRVAEEAPSLPQPGQNFECLEFIQNVFPDVRFARASMNESVATDPCICR